MGPPLPDELVEEILLRVPPSDPASLARAAASSKRLCRLVTGPGFRRRYHAFHGAPPMLGILLRHPIDGDGFSSLFVPTSSFRPPRAEHRGLLPLDARHGRVLFLRADGDNHSGRGGAIDLLVWDPITDEMVELPRPVLLECPFSWKAAVLCAVPAANCDHLDCHRGPFLVVLVATNSRTTRICVYSSEPTALPAEAEASPYDFSITTPRLFPFIESSGVAQRRSPLVGNALYFMCGARIVMYDWCRQHCSIEDPFLLSNIKLLPPVAKELVTMGDGRLALAAVADSALYMVPGDGELGWGEMKTIAFENPLPLHTSLAATPRVVSFAEGNGLVFLRIGNEIFSLDIKSTQVTMPARLKKVCEGLGIVPYINFCTPVMGVLSTDDEPKAGASTDE